MRIGLLNDGKGLGAYTNEILSVWGLMNVRQVAGGELEDLDVEKTPVLVFPAGVDEDGSFASAALGFVQRGGNLIVCLPGSTLAQAAGVGVDGLMESPQRLRLTQAPMAGLAGESLVVVGPSQRWKRMEEDAAMWAVLYQAGEEVDMEGPGIVQRSVGKGSIMALAFDLPLAVLMLRQGDPANTESTGRADGPARPSHLACHIGPQEPDSIPYADLLGRLLLELATSLFPCPVPHMWHLPQGVPGIVVYSGDEDTADVEWNQQQFREMTDAGGRMNLYLIPGNTHSTPADVADYQKHHDVGPHPNIRALDGAPVSARVDEMVRQIREFEEMFGVPARSLRNHCISWAGYLEPVRGMAECGVGMDGNYFCSTFLRDRGYAPYAGFGAAMPLRFGLPDGELISVRQQHTHTMDDVYFGPENVPYSYRMSPELWETVLGRVLDDVAQRFHVPHATCIHPSNWVRFSRDQGLALVRLGLEREMPVWSFDQWLTFLEARETWRCESIQWDGERLAATFSGDGGPFAFVLPQKWRDREIVEIEARGGVVDPETRRFGETVRMIRADGESKVEVMARYR
jgi:hypothetical protein